MFPQIRINQTHAQIGLRKTEPIQELEQRPAQLALKQQPAQMSIDRKPAVLEINQEQLRYDLNMKTPSTFSTENAAEARNAALEAVATISQEGDQLAAIEHKKDALNNIITSKVNPRPADTTIKFIPSHGSVKLNFTPTELKINWERGGVQADYTPFETVHNYTPGKIEVYLRQKQQLEIDFVGLNVNSKS
ncbi:hypothetical protein AM500_22685 [Bacillus sp. FJAT-18017]|uniref:DUF6470 family protein n=1 Tax=Bacillus sp. FJAT-18017 TaxID=1705566 RepID=UPI0006ADB439|nr:DUF6470 family protein [Bacillus sp. FJAT-18017]ALC92263.1 hypothetical protein AM500_22685 [Bacillus sp. FJAT-18017]